MRTDGLKLPVPEEKAARLRSAARADRKVILGIRPEHIYDAQFAPKLGTVGEVQATVDVVEPLGGELNLYLIAGEHTFVARVDTRTWVRSGQTVRLVADMERAHFFDPETERNLLFEEG